MNRKDSKLRHNHPAMGGSTSSEQDRVMTVALLREPKEAEEVEVAFSESARFYRLLRKNPNFAKILSQLRAAKEKRRAVRVFFDQPHGEVIEDVQGGA